MKLQQPTMHWLEAVLRNKFPLCTFGAIRRWDECTVRLWVRDSGGLLAIEEVREEFVCRDAEPELWKVIGRLADVFETPSHWMAL